MFKTQKNKEYRGDKYHDLCQRCWRDQKNRTGFKPTKEQHLQLEFPPLAVMISRAIAARLEEQNE